MKGVQISLEAHKEIYLSVWFLISSEEAENKVTLLLSKNAPLRIPLYLTGLGTLKLQWWQRSVPGVRYHIPVSQLAKENVH